MKLKIWENERGEKHITLDGIEIGAILTGLDLCMRVGNSPEVDLRILSSSLEVEVDTKVGVIIDGDKYWLESIKKE